jgi:hypothetical protein
MDVTAATETKTVTANSSNNLRRKLMAAPWRARRCLVARIRPAGFQDHERWDAARRLIAGEAEESRDAFAAASFLR